jgi:AcrR family transcriptional regulator
MPPKKPASGAKAPRKRRTADEAREAILDAAERHLVASGPDGIRLQEVAADVGVSHPTVLHHFGSREGLVKAVVGRALESLHRVVLEAVGRSEGVEHMAKVLDEVARGFTEGGHARAFLWLALSGYAPDLEDLRIRGVAEAVHQVRTSRRGAKKRMPPFEDTYFTVLLAAVSLLSLSVIPAPTHEAAGDVCSARRFREWLARLMHDHLEAE